MSEDFSVSKLEYLLSDLANISHNILFVQLYSDELVNELWVNLTNCNQINSVNSLQLELKQLLLMAFASDESIPGKIRKGEFHFSNKFYKQEGVLTLTADFEKTPKGLLSEVINSLGIRHVILTDQYCVDLFFSIDFNLSLNTLRTITIKNIEKSYKNLSTILFNNTVIEEIHLINVPEELLPVDVSQMLELRKLVIIDAPLTKLPKLNHQLEVLTIERTNIRQIDFQEYPLQNLKELRITHGKLMEIKNLSSLLNLTYLDVSRQAISNLELANLNKLEVVIARRNKLSKFPNLNLSKHTLRVLDLSFNAIQLTEEIEEFIHLEKFLFESNKFPILNELFLPFQHVYRLDLAANEIVQISPILSNFKRLSVLNLENNNLENVEEVIHSIPTNDLEVRLRGNNLSNQEKIKLSNLASKTVSL